MLKVEINKDGDIYISGEVMDLRDLQRQIEEAIDHQMPFTKTYQDFKWNAHEKTEKPKNVTVRVTP